MRVLQPRPLSVSRQLSLAIPSLAVLLAFGLTGCQKLGLKAPEWSFDKLMLRSQNPEDDEEDDDEFESSIDIPMVGEYVTFSGLNRVVLEGVGLVHGLNRTGGNPPPSPYRDLLMDDMRRRNVKDAKQLLQSQIQPSSLCERFCRRSFVAATGLTLKFGFLATQGQRASMADDCWKPF